MSTTISCPAGFFQGDEVNNTTVTDLLSAVDAALAQVDNSLTSATAAAASATAAAASALTALGAANGVTTGVTAAATSASDAAASAATATTQASAAAASATTASTQATSAAAQAAAAATSASGASASVTAAANSATTASTQATNASASATAAANSAAAVPPLLSGFLGGLKLSFNSATVVGISAGSCTDSTAAASITLGAFTKSTAGAWAAGSGSNGMGTGLTIANVTWYHVFAIIKSGAADVYFDTSVTAANKPAGTTAFRRLGSFFTSGTAQIFSWVQNGDEFLWGVGALDVNAVSVATASRALKTLTVPPGVQVNALCRVTMSNAGSAAALIITSPDETDQSGIGDLACPTGGVGVAGRYNIRTNTSGQIALRCITSASIVNVQTYGWVDIRGQG